MAWRIKFTRQADKAIYKLDKSVAVRVFDALDEIASLENPRSRGKALTGNFAGLWRYRVGDYRILCDIQDEMLLILVIDVDHRSRVYRTQKSIKAPSAASIMDAAKQAQDRQEPSTTHKETKGISR